MGSEMCIRDRCQFLDHDFLCRWVSGEPVVGDDESSHTGFFSIDQLPPMAPRHCRRIETALNPADTVIMSSDMVSPDIQEVR